MFEIENNPGIKTAEQLIAEGQLDDLQQDVDAIQSAKAPEAEQEVESAPLTIEESTPSKTPASATKKRASTATPTTVGRPKKRKAEEANLTPTQNESKVKKSVADESISDTPATPSSIVNEPEKLSRSGRVIKKKRFDDSIMDGSFKVWLLSSIYCDFVKP
jgi:hypothetical protein